MISIPIENCPNQKSLPDARQIATNFEPKINVYTGVKIKPICDGLIMAYSGGLRISEVITLRINDIDSQRMQIRIHHSKGHKDRQTILSNKALKLLREYYKFYKPDYWLFEGRKAKQYSVSSVRNIFKHSCAKENIEKQLTVHSLRHSFATHLLEQGVSIQIIQRLLGHSNAKTTCGYLHVQQYSIDKVLSPIDFKDNT